MSDFTTLEGAKELFAQVNGLGRENCIFFVSNTTMNSSATGNVIGGSLFGGIGSAVGMAVGLSKDLEKRIPTMDYFMFLCNKTEDSFGFIPIRPKKLFGKESDIDNYIFDLDRYACLKDDEIEKIEVKPYPMDITKNVKSLKIKTKDGFSYSFRAIMKYSWLPYQEENFGKNFSVNYANMLNRSKVSSSTVQNNLNTVPQGNVQSNNNVAMPQNNVTNDIQTTYETTPQSDVWDDVTDNVQPNNNVTNNIQSTYKTTPQSDVWDDVTNNVQSNNNVISKTQPTYETKTQGDVWDDVTNNVQPNNNVVMPQNDVTTYTQPDYIEIPQSETLNNTANNTQLNNNTSTMSQDVANNLNNIEKTKIKDLESYAWVSLVLSIASIFILHLFLSAGAIILGYKAYKGLKGKGNGSSYAIIGMLIGGIIFVLNVLRSLGAIMYLASF